MVISKPKKQNSKNSKNKNFFLKKNLNEIRRDKFNFEKTTINFCRKIFHKVLSNSSSFFRIIMIIQ